MNPNVDLSRLAVHRAVRPSGQPTSVALAPPRRIWSRYVLPLSLVLGLISVLAWAARDSFLPAAAVTVRPVYFTQSTIEATDAPLFKTAGWVEPSPAATQVSAQVDGFVEQLPVVQGQAVKRGQVVAKLIDIDARLALRESEVDRQLRAAELRSAEATAEAARITLKNPVHLEAALAEADALLARVQNELAVLPVQLQGAEAKQLIARQEHDGKREAGEAVSGRSLQRAKSELDAAQAVLDELTKKRPRLENEEQSLARRREALKKQLELRTDETRKAAEAEAQVAVFNAKLDQAEIAYERATTHLNRMQIKSPSDGVVMAVVAKLGKRVMGKAENSEHDGSTIVTLYDPDSLQIRADVRLEDVPRVQLDQKVLVQTPSATEPIAAQVIAITSQADIQKNTLEVKVKLVDPPRTVKPEMLVQVTFLAPPSPVNTDAKPSTRMRVFVPKSFIQTGEPGSTVWIADTSAKVAKRKSVTVGTTVLKNTGSQQNMVEVEGLSPSDKLIVGGREGLADGQRIRVTGTDEGE